MTHHQKKVAGPNVPGLSLLQTIISSFTGQSLHCVLLESPRLPDRERVDHLRALLPPHLNLQAWLHSGLPDQPLSPFLPWIREHLAGRQASEIGQFLEKTQVYSQQRGTFFHYFLGENAGREEDLILEEANFERRMAWETLDRQLAQLWGTQPQVLYLASASGLTCGTLDYLIHLLKTQTKKPWLVILEFHPSELASAPERWRRLWDELTDLIETCGEVITPDGNQLPEPIQPPSWKWPLPRDGLQLFFHFFCFDDVILGAQQRISDMGRTFLAGMEEAFLRDILGTAWLFAGDLDNAGMHYHNLLVIAKEKGLTGVLAEAYRKTGLIQYKKDNSEAALRFASQSLKLAENNRSDKGIFKALFLILMIDARENQLDQAHYEEIYFRFLSLGETLGQRNHLAYWMARPDRLDPLARAAEVDDLQTKAIRTLEKSGNLFRLAAAYHTRGFTYIVRGQYGEVPIFYRKSEKLKALMGNPLETAYLQNGTGYFYHQRGESRLAEAYCFKALTNARQARDYHEVGMVLCNMAINYLYSGQNQAAWHYLHELSALLGVLRIPGLSYHSPFELRALTACAALRSGKTLRFWEDLARLRSVKNRGRQDDSRLQSRVEENLLYLVLEAWGRALQGWVDAAEEGFAEAEDYFLANQDIVSYRGWFLYEEWQRFRSATPGAKPAAELNGKCKSPAWAKGGKKPQLVRTRPYPDFAGIREAARLEVDHQLYQKKLEEIQFLKALQLYLHPSQGAAFLRNSLDLIRNSFVCDWAGYLEFRPEGVQTTLATGTAALPEEDTAHLLRAAEAWAKALQETLVVADRGNWPAGLTGLSWLALPVRAAAGWNGLLLLGTLRTQIPLTLADAPVLAIASQQLTAHLERLETLQALSEARRNG